MTHLFEPTDAGAGPTSRADTPTFESTETFEPGDVVQLELDDDGNYTKIKTPVSAGTLAGGLCAVVDQVLAQGRYRCRKYGIIGAFVLTSLSGGLERGSALEVDTATANTMQVLATSGRVCRGILLEDVPQGVRTFARVLFTGDETFGTFGTTVGTTTTTTTTTTLTTTTPTTSTTTTLATTTPTTSTTTTTTSTTTTTTVATTTLATTTSTTTAATTTTTVATTTVATTTVATTTKFPPTITSQTSTVA